MLLICVFYAHVQLCAKHHFGMKKTDRISQQTEGQGKAIQKTWNTIKSAAENVKPRKVRGHGFS